MGIEWFQHAWRRVLGDRAHRVDADVVTGETHGLGLHTPAPVQPSGLNPFALRLLATLPRADTQVISPQCIGLALTMLARGTDGRSYAELRDALGLPDAPDALERFVDQLQAVESGDSERNCVVESAAALWPHHGTPVLESFVSDVKRWFAADVVPVDFQDAGATLGRVNDWCSRRTHGRITRIAEQLPVPPALLLTTALYFKGRWATPFRESATTTAPFHAPSGRVDVRLMYQAIEASYVESADLQAVALPYFGAWRLSVILPRPSSSLDGVVQRLQKPGELARLVHNMAERKVMLSLPRVSIDSGIVSMPRVLKTLGIEAVFDFAAADLTRLTPLVPSAVTEIAHRATLDVHEAGTVAAAASAVHIRCGSAPNREVQKPVEMRVDRPYLMLLQRAYDGMILFAATVTRPPKAS